MRDIKIRAWDNLEKRMRKVVSLHWQGDKLVSARLEGENEPIPIEGRLVIEQDTGLKDKNGAEIHEGDMVQYYSRHYGVPYKVYWADKSARFLIGRNGVIGQELSSVMYNLDTDRIALEVVSNIHENPELLQCNENSKKLNNHKGDVKK